MFIIFTREKKKEEKNLKVLCKKAKTNFSKQQKKNLYKFNLFSLFTHKERKRKKTIKKVIWFSPLSRPG